MGATAVASHPPPPARPELSDDFVQKFKPIRFEPIPFSMDLPVLLPQDINGRHLSVLSKSAMEDIWCPLRFQQRRLLKKYGHRTVALLAGSAGEAGIEAMLDANLLRGQPITVADALDAVDDYWVQRLRSEYVDFGDERPSAVRDQVKACVRHYLTEVVPAFVRDGWQLVALQHSFHDRLAPHLRWTVNGVIDQVWYHPATGLYRFRDTKFSKTNLTPYKARQARQPKLYVSAAQRAALPFERFYFDSYNRKTGALTVLPVRLTEAQMIETWATVQSAVVQIVAINDRLGLHRPWPLTLDHEHWRCSEDYCSVWGACPRGQMR
jgi:PD-(D/E)XK nuclease superfamily